MREQSQPENWYEELSRDARLLDQPRTGNKPRRPRDCSRHEYLVSDRCFFCGAPMPVPDTERLTRG